MKRNKKQDWTDILRERLQDAELPLAGGWTGAAGPAVGQDQPRRVLWWPWALTSVAVAAFAGLLFLRTPDHHSRLNPREAPVRIPEQPAAEEIPASPVVEPASPTVILAAPMVISAEEPESPLLPSEGIHAGEEIPNQVRNNEAVGRNDAASARNATTQANPSSPMSTPTNQTTTANPTANPANLTVIPASPIVIPAEEPESPAPRRKPRLSLRVHAASVSSVNTASAIGVPHNGAIQFSDAFADQDTPEFYYGNVSDGGLATSALDNGQLFPVRAQNTGLFPNYMSDYASNIINPVAVPRAPTIPISFGVSAELSLSRHWSLLAGLDYTQRSGYHVLDNTPQSLTLHYLGIPLEARYVFWPESRFRLYLGAGAKVEKCFLTTGGTPLRDPFLVSLNVHAGADVRIFPGIRLYFSPVFSGYLTHSAYTNTWDSRPQISLRVGLSFDL